MLKFHDYSIPELAMRGLLFVQANPGVPMADLVHRLMRELGISRATAYRLVSVAVCVLGIEPPKPDRTRAVERAADTRAERGTRPGPRRLLS